MRRSMRMRASATVEAAFVVPIILLSIFGVIIFCFYMCDRIKLNSDLVRFAEHELTRYELVRSTDESEAEDYLNGLLSKGYIFCVPNHTVETVGDGRIEVTVNLRFGRLKNGLGRELTSPLAEYTVHKSLDIRNREQELRRINLGIDLINKGGS